MHFRLILRSSSLARATRVEQLMPQPSSFQSISFRISNGLITSNLENEIKKGMDWDKPPVHFTHSLHKSPETFINFSIFKET